MKHAFTRRSAPTSDCPGRRALSAPLPRVLTNQAAMTERSSTSGWNLRCRPQHGRVRTHKEPARASSECDVQVRCIQHFRMEDDDNISF